MNQFSSSWEMSVISAPITLALTEPEVDRTVEPGHLKPGSFYL